ncbi:hypothetical protein PLICRDRAFT_109895 [Plicaturopsis crispa FD-325 SS-3]|nr:hypothetical protein PLICRDRAFT_109895 [Plicaturopsis crispa FD-325 SS-3]
MTDWTTNANTALHISLVRASDDDQPPPFHPTFTYPIYGEEETIYGYDGLRIDLRFASGSLAQYLAVTHTAKLPASKTVDDVEGALAKVIPPDYYTDEAAFRARVEADADAFKPLGERIHSYVKGGVEFEVYHVRTTWATPGFREYHRRMQLFVLLYIEAGSYIAEDEDRWEFVVLYEKRKRPSTDAYTYHFAGYSSLYNFYCFPERIRMRLSQFVILPPYQRQGHGSALYTALYTHVRSRPDVAELTVEDPAEAFEDLRDACDLRMLLSHSVFIEEAFGTGANTGGGGGKVQKGKSKARGKGRGKMGPPAEKGWLEKWRVEFKIASRQFQRLAEMLLLLHLDAADERAYRLQVKERLYRFNYEVLVQLDKAERVEKLEETFQSVRADYLRILGMVKAFL